MRHKPHQIWRFLAFLDMQWGHLQCVLESNCSILILAIARRSCCVQLLAFILTEGTRENTLILQHCWQGATRDPWSVRISQRELESPFPGGSTAIQKLSSIIPKCSHSSPWSSTAKELTLAAKLADCRQKRKIPLSFSSHHDFMTQAYLFSFYTFLPIILWPFCCQVILDQFDCPLTWFLVMILLPGWPGIR